MATNVTPPDEKTVSISNENVIIVINEQPNNSVSVSTNTTNITVEEASAGTSTTLEQANSVTANQETTVVTVTQDTANNVTVNNDGADQITVSIGPSGPQGDTGAAGTDGLNDPSSFKYTFIPERSEPFVGQIGIPVRDHTSANKIYISNTDDDSRNIETYLESFASVDATIKAQIVLRSIDDTSKFVIYNITDVSTADNANNVEMDVTHIDSNGTFLNGPTYDDVLLSIYRSGPKGDTGDSILDPNNSISIANITASGAISASDYIFAKGLFINSASKTPDFFLIQSSSLSVISVNQEGVFTLGAFTYEPTAEKGGLYYNDTDDAFYAGLKE